MPIATIQIPDGRTVELEVPEGATEQQILEFVQSQDFGQAESAPQTAPEAAPAAQQPAEGGSVRDLVEGQKVLGGELEQMMKTPAAPAIAAGFGSAVNEVGQALSDWAAKGLDYVGLEGPAEAVGEFADSLEGREQAIQAGAEQLTKEWYRSLHGEEPMDEDQLKRTVKHGREVADFGAKLGGAFAGGALVFGAKTFAGAAGISTAEGAVSAALLGESDKPTVEGRIADRLGELKVGGALGLATGSMSGVFTSARNFLAKHVAKHADDATSSFNLADEFDVNLTFGQASGNPTLQNIEQQAQGDIAQRFMAQQANEAGERIGQRIGVQVKHLDDVGKGTGQALRDTEQQVRLAVTKMKVARNEAWRGSIDEALELAGDAPLYKPHDMVGVLRDVETDVMETFGSKVPLSEDMMGLIDEMEAASAGAGINAAQVNKWWKRVNEWKSSGFGVFDSGVPGVKEGQYKQMQQVLAGKLSGALDNSIAQAQTTASGPAAQAMAKLRGAREGYKNASREIRTIEDDFLTALGMQGSPRQVMETLSRVDPDITRQVVKHIKKLDGGEAYVAQLRDAVYDSARHAGMQGAVPKPGQSGDVDIAAFAEALADGTRRSVLSGIAEPAMEKRAKEGVSILRKMLNAEPQQMGRAKVTQLPVSFQDVAINAMSRNPGFMARLLASSIARGHNMESLFFTPEGIQTLRAFRPEVVKHGGMAGKRNAAVVFLSNQIGEDAKNEADANLQQTINALRSQR